MTRNDQPATSKDISPERQKKRPIPSKLWEMAGEDAGRYDELLVEYGYIAPAPAFPENLLSVEEIHALAAAAHPYAERLYHLPLATVAERKMAAMLKGLALGVDQLTTEKAALAGEVDLGTGRLEDLTLERDRLAHELRLLQEAVHVPDLEAEQVARRAAEEAAIAAGEPYPCFQAQPALTRDCASDGYYLCEGCGLRVLVQEEEAGPAGILERLGLKPLKLTASLSSDTPERSGSDTFAGGEG